MSKKYVDVDEIKKRIHCDNPEMRDYKTLMAFIDHLPASDVVPVIHAKWEPAFMGLELVCSNCRKSPHNLMQYDYCPFCSAKMSKCDEGYQTVVCKVEDNKDEG